MSGSATSTPLLDQYEGVKARYPGHLVLFRVGDFYETFGEDAKLLSRELELTLTARSADASGQRTPMAGVPQHAVESYLGRLVGKGYKVALCDQVEDARLAKGLVRREVTRVVTPGTVVEERLLGGPDHNFLACAVVSSSGNGAYAAVDVSTGEWFQGAALSGGFEGLVTAIAAFSPRELLLAGEPEGPRRSGWEATLRREFPRVRLEPAPPPDDLSTLPPALRTSLSLVENPVLAEAGARLAAYVRSTQPRLLPYLVPIVEEGSGRRLVLDPKTLRHLEISKPMNPDDPGGMTLLSAYDGTHTSAGRRTLSFWLKNPLADVEAIRRRQDAVESLLGRGASLTALQGELSEVADLGRIATRLAGRRIRPAELKTLEESLRATGKARDRLASGPAPGRLANLVESLAPPSTLSELLRVALPDTLPITLEPGSLFRPGYAPELDALHAVELGGLAEVEALEREEQNASGIRTLRVGYNQVFGYYFEVSRPHLAKVPPHFRRKQTLSNGERFTTERLSSIEERILSARESVGTKEAERWELFLGEVETHVPRLHLLSRAVGELDALCTLARVALDRGHVRPVVDESGVLQVRDGRHPVLERTLARGFVPNDTDLDAADGRLLVLTGPNMSGKSTYMRQVGLLVVLAQAGAFVPAKFARVGLVSSLYTRMGFTDEIGRGKSSFMVEMSEVAEILRDADARSLVLLDEVGRGTSTFDGLALAWATLRHLHDRVRCRTLLATHYHQLTELIERLPGAANGHLAVRDTDGDVVFLHRLVPGSTDKSYGIHVAKLAGLPPELLQEAGRLLRQLEAQGVGLPPTSESKKGAVRYTQAVLLASETAAPTPSPMEVALEALDPDHMSPIEALHWVSEWRKRLRRPAEEPPA
ncbi:MAG: DNA mismatch repair protein MutS [Thermoplasmata archaeon]|nr:DNA mismatch repair protein MutS [Thermoplasmata archaeon]